MPRSISRPRMGPTTTGRRSRYRIFTPKVRVADGGLAFFLERDTGA